MNKIRIVAFLLLLGGGIIGYLVYSSEQAGSYWAKPFKLGLD